jgi:chorismate-pyruvate lyase
MKAGVNGAAGRAAASVPTGSLPLVSRNGQGGVLFPLDFVYERSGIEQPKIRLLGPEDIPYPYRTLLAHTNDMTLTLERHFGGRVVVRPLSTLRRSTWYVRRVLLAQEYSGKPVEMGAIKINLKSFPERLRRQIYANQIPLGRLLRDGGVPFESRPRCFFEVIPNSEMMGVFWMREPRPLYGRRTEIFVHASKFGDIVEILPLV